ncbi:MAG: hypothetical protein K6E58_01590 [Eubacterium sp.]|nr:hypothetical protein [Eubacterium sp.]
MKRKLAILLSLMISMTFVLSACGKEVVEGTDSLRCDGVYRTVNKKDNGSHYYMRFYKEGKVHVMFDDKKLSPKEAYEELNTLSNPNQLNQKVFASNTFKVNDNVIIESSVDGVNKKMKAPDVEFTYRTRMGLNTCYLKVRDNMLKMKMVNGQGEEYEYTYKFAECD